jgi:uncharacterized protein YxeA
MNKNRDLEKENQVQVERFELSEEVTRDLEMFLENQKPTIRKRINQLVGLGIDNNGKPVVASNKELVESGEGQLTSLQTTKRICIEHGIIQVRKAYMPCGPVPGMGRAQVPNEYHVNPKFIELAHKARLDHLLPALKKLKWFCLSLLMVTGSLFSRYKVDNAYLCHPKGKVILTKNLTSPSGRIKRIKRARIRNFRNQEMRNFLKRVRKVAKEEWDPVNVIQRVPLRIRQVKVIKLTPHGMMRLMCFPDEAIAWAEQKLNKSSKFIYDPFAYFVQLCNEYCKIHDIEPDYTRFNAVKESYGYRDDKPMVHVDVVYRKKALVTPPQKMSGSGGKAHPLPEPDSFACTQQSEVRGSQSPDGTDSQEIPQTGKNSDLEQGEQSSPLGEKEKTSYSPNAKGSLSREESNLVKRAENCKTYHANKEYKGQQEFVRKKMYVKMDANGKPVVTEEIVSKQSNELDHDSLTGLGRSMLEDLRKMTPPGSIDKS